MRVSGFVWFCLCLSISLYMLIRCVRVPVCPRVRVCVVYVVWCVLCVCVLCVVCVVCVLCVCVLCVCVWCVLCFCFSLLCVCICVSVRLCVCVCGVVRVCISVCNSLCMEHVVIPNCQHTIHGLRLHRNFKVKLLQLCWPPTCTCKEGQHAHSPFWVTRPLESDKRQ